MNHLKQIAEKLPEYGLDAMLITSESGERYALGFHGEGLLLVTRNGAHYTTDGRYIEAAQEQVQGADVKLVTRDSSHLAQARAFLEERGLHNVGFESGNMTVDAHRRYSQELPCILTPAQQLLDDLRASKDEEELAVMRHAQEITDGAFKAVLDFIRPGMTEREIAARLVYEMMRRGGEKVSFDPIVAAGPNGSRPHAVPGDQVVDTGMFITMDFGCKVDGYCSDMTRTVAMGEPTDEMEQVYATVLAAQRAGINAARAGATGREVDAAGRQVIAEAGYGEYFTHRLGHFIGQTEHEQGDVSATADVEARPGMIFSIEPGVYLPGEFGVRVEDLVLVTEDGCEILNHVDKHWKSVG